MRLRCTSLTGWTTEILRTALFDIVTDQPPKVALVSPATGATVDGTVWIEAHATDDHGIIAGWLYVDGTRYGIGSVDYPPSGDTTIRIDWDAGAAQEGNHQLEMLVFDTALQTASAHIDLTVLHVAPPPEQTPPELRIVSRDVTRIENYLDVQLRVRNAGDLPATDVQIFDELQGFQPIPVEKLHPDITVRPRWFPASHCGDVEITDARPLLHDQETVYRYRLVPVLTYPNPKPPAIGTWTSLHCAGPCGPVPRFVKQPTSHTTKGETIPAAHAAACLTANYLIVTNPIRLVGLHCPAYYSGFGSAPRWQDTNDVLSTMALLAVAKQGVLGYFHGNTADELRDLIRTGSLQLPSGPAFLPSGASTAPQGTWAQQLHQSFCEPGRGWLLIVGEYQIVPSWTVTGIGVPEHEDGSDYIRQSDYRYADTMGDEFPELIVGRIIGDTPADLSRGLRASLGVRSHWPGYGNDLSSALAISGTGDFVDDFVDSVNDFAGRLAGKGTPTSVIHEKYSGPGQAVTDFKALAAGRDFVLVDGHGLPPDAGPLTIKNLPGTDFHGSNPVVWASACLTGNYDWLTETKPAAPNGTISEQFFLLDAGGYFGSTEIASATVGKAAIEFVADHWTPTMPPAYQFHLLKSWFASGWWMNGKRRGFNYEYNYYGDPKIGTTALDPLEMSGVMKIQQAASASLLGAGSAEVDGAEVDAADAGGGWVDHVVRLDLPELRISRSHGVDHVVLPGSGPQVDDGLPEVPSYAASCTFPAGTAVQDVVLRARTGLVEGTGLQLANVVDGPNGRGRRAVQADRRQADSRQEWYPTTDFQWRRRRHADGSTTLTLLVSPFHYRSSTGGYRFHRTCEFLVRTAQTTATIRSLSTGKPAYRNGETIGVTTEVRNAGTARDLVLGITVRRIGQAQVLDGLPVRALAGVEGRCVVTQRWQPDQLPPGDYVLDAELRASDGTWLDSMKGYVRLGVEDARTLGLAATESRTRSGSGVALDLKIANTGSEPIAGTAVVQVIDEQGTTVADLRHESRMLEPDQATTLRLRWDTTDVAPGTYSAIGHLRFCGRATDPVVTSITLRR